MKRIAILFLALTGCAGAGSTAPGGPSPYNRQLSGAELVLVETSRAKVFEFLAFQCGAQTPDSEFGLSVAQLPRDSQRFLLDVLRGGPPAEAREINQAQAAARFERRREWLQSEGEALFADEARSLLDRDREAYVTDHLRSYDALYRQNAARALGFVGDARLIPEMEAVSAARPELTDAIGLATARIRERTGGIQ